MRIAWSDEATGMRVSASLSAEDTASATSARDKEQDSVSKH